MTFADEFEALLTSANRLPPPGYPYRGHSDALARLQSWQEDVFVEFSRAPVKEQLNSAYAQLERSESGQRAATLLLREVKTVREVVDLLNRPGKIIQSKKARELTSIVVGSLKDILGDLVPGLGALLAVLQEAIDALT